MPGIDLTDISGAATQQQRNTLIPIQPTPTQSQQAVSEEEAPVESLPERTSEPKVIEKNGHIIKTGGAKIKTNAFLGEVDGSKQAGEVQVKAGEVDDAQREFLKKTTWIE